MSDIFCKIISKELKADIVMEDEEWLAIYDIHPQAPVHVLIIPKKHIEDMVSLTDADSELVGKLVVATGKVAKKLGIDYKGFRLIVNQGEDGGQIVPHLHLHLLGGKHFGPKIVQ